MHELLKTIPQDIAEQIAAKLEPVLVLADEDESFASHLAVQQAARVWAGSDFVINWCLRNQTAFKSLLESGDLQNAYTEDDYLTRLKEQCETDFNPDKKRIFRLFRNREMVRIAWRDLCGADLNETLRDLSLLAEACIDVGLKVVRENLLERFGYPQDSAAEEIPLVILAMGKLGAHELNYSSDIDLIFVYAEEGETQGGRRSTSHHEYFTHVARQFIDLLNSPTADGFVFRTDARLRPFGDSGSLVVSFNALENYYERHGREWERYALIKANILNARKSDKQELIARIKPFVFRRYLDYSVFDSLREMKDMIAKEVQRKGMDENVKLGPGGIREVEFIGQAFQMIRGGREPRLQARAIQPVLKTLAELNILADHIAKALLKGYDFLRKVENRIQAYADQQTHNLPQDEIQRRRLAFAMGFDNWPDFLRGLNKHRDKIHDAFEQVFVAPQADAPEPQSKAADNPYEGLWQGRMAEDEAASLLDQSGFENALNAVRLINALRDGSVCKSLSPRGRARLDRLMPMIIGAVAKLKGPDETLARLVRLVERVARRTAYLALLVEHPMVVSQLVQLCHRSSWIADQITHHPLLLDELLDPRQLYETHSRAQMDQEIGTRLSGVDAADVEQQMDVLRQFQQVNSLRVAAAELTGAMPINKVSDHLTDIAETVLNSVLYITWAQMVEKHGLPVFQAEGEQRSAGFAVIGYGKLGGFELGFGSDLDLVFLHDSHGVEQHSQGEKSVDNAVFFARMGQRIIHFLGTQTVGGVLYEVDTRLRPSGGSGLLVSSLDAFSAYQENEAWTWEHQALVRARPVAGNEAIFKQFKEIRRHVLCKQRDPVTLQTEVRDMRYRMRQELAKKVDGQFDLKHGEGGIGDIEFIVQYLVLRWAHEYPELTVWPDNLRILESLDRAKLLTSDDATMLANAYLAYRHKAHEMSLQRVPALADENEFSQFRAEVSRVWAAVMES